MNKKLKKWVLLVDDDKDLIDLYESFLEMHLGDDVKILKVEDTVEIMGPYNIPCLSLKFYESTITEVVPIVKDNTEAITRYNSIKTELLNNAKRDFKQWVHYPSR